MRSVVVTVAAVALVLTGCSGGGDPVVTTPVVVPTAAQPSPSATHTPLEPGGVFVDTADSQAEGEFVGALKDVSGESCAAGDATWVGAGTLVNPTADDVNYRVWVAFLDSEGDTIGLVQSNVDGVEAGESGDYSASMPYSEAGPLTCVLRVERRAAS